MNREPTSPSLFEYISTSFCPSSRLLGDVDAVKVVGSEGAVALGALPLPGVVAHLQTLVTEDVETLGEHRLLVPGVAAGAAQLGLQTEGNTFRGQRHADNPLRHSSTVHEGQVDAGGGTRKLLIPEAGLCLEVEISFWPLRRAPGQTEELEALFTAARVAPPRPERRPDLVLVDLLLQDLVSVRVHLHLLLFLQLPSQPRQVFLKKASGEGMSKRVPVIHSGVLHKNRVTGAENTTYLRSLQVVALPLPGGPVLGHGDLDLLQLGLRVLQLHLQVLSQLGGLHRLQEGGTRHQKKK